MTARDLARFGLLCLRHGRWNNEQIAPEAWVKKSTHPYEMVKAGGVDVGGYEYLWRARIHLAEFAVRIRHPLHVVIELPQTLKNLPRRRC